MTDNPIKLLICGGRDFVDWELFNYALDNIKAFYPEGISTIITGDAKGADQMARIYAQDQNLALIVEYADWTTHGKSAGPIRNRKLLEHNPDVVLAFPGGKGTANMVSQAKDVGIRVWEVGYNPPVPKYFIKSKYTIEPCIDDTIESSIDDLTGLPWSYNGDY